MFFDLGNLEHLSYLGIVILFIGSALVPIPEELLLLFIGYGAATGIIHWWLALPICLISAAIGDFTLFHLSKHGSRYINKFILKIKPEKIEKLEDKINHHYGKTIFSARFIAGLRFPSIILSGTRQISGEKFLIYNTLALLIYIPILIFLGYHFHSEFTALLTEATAVRNYISISAYLLIGLISSAFIFRMFVKNGKI